MTTFAPPRRRWFSFSLRTFFLFLTLTALVLPPLAWRINHYRPRRFDDAAIKQGMTREGVRAIAGEPHQLETNKRLRTKDEAKEVWLYWKSPTGYLIVVFSKDGTVEETSN